MSRFFVISDIHFHLWSYGDPYSRLVDIAETLTDALEVAESSNVDAVLFTGDIFHTHGNISTVVLNTVYDRIVSFKDWLKPRAVFIPGNHDMVYRNDSDHNSICFLEQFGTLISNVFSARHSAIHINNMPPIHCLPYTENKETLKSFLDSCTDNSIVMLHQGVSGVEVNSKGFTINEFLTSDMIPDRILHAFSGHYHTCKSVSPKLTIPGALVPHNFGDAGEIRGYLDISIDSKNITFNHVKSSHYYSFEKIDYLNVDNFLETNEYKRGLETVFLSVVNVPIGAAIDLKKKLTSAGIVDPKIISKKIEDSDFQKVDSTIDSLPKMLETYITRNNFSDEIANIGRGLIRENT